MSHVTKIKSVPIKDVRALRAAVEELKRQGVQCELVEKATPRLWNQAQMNAHKDCDYVLKLHNAKYDVGFERTTENVNGVEVTIYNPITDFYTGTVRREIGYPDTKEGEDENQTGLGKLFHEYSIYAAMYAAIDTGYNCERTVDQYGQVQLVMTGMY